MAAGQLPRAAVADVRQADGAPGEEGGEAGEGEQPVEGRVALGREGDVGQQAEDQGDHERDPRTAVLVDLGEDLGRHAVQRERLDRARRAVGARVRDGDDGDGDDGVDDGGEDFNAGQDAGAHEWRVLGVGAAGSRELFVVGGDDEAEEEEGEDVEQSDTPEDLLGGLWKRLSGVVGLGSCETNQLGTGEGEGGSDEDGAEALESVLECGIWFVPVRGSDVASVA